MPDFFQARFFNNPLITKYDKWTSIKYNKIAKEDERKFRFLKNYSAEQNDHQKELEYFELEMTAKAKGLKWFEKIIDWLYAKTSNYA